MVVDFFIRLIVCGSSVSFVKWMPAIFFGGLLSSKCDDFGGGGPAETYSNLLCFFFSAWLHCCSWLVLLSQFCSQPEIAFVVVVFVKSLKASYTIEAIPMPADQTAGASSFSQVLVS